jgi:ribosomal protein S18 acetylase RimI-like enzyme
VPRIGFRPLAESDFPLLFKWLSRPHVRRWYAPEPRSFMELLARYGPRARADSVVEAFVIEVDGADAGYIQKYDIAHFGDYRRLLGLEDESGVAGMDLFIGDEWRTGGGLGSLAIGRFFAQRVLADASVRACVAGPHEANAGSIRAFEKAGFRRWKAVANERGERECVLRRERDTARCRVAPIQWRDAGTCVRLRREMYVASFGSEDGLEEEMGPDNALYLEQLRLRMAQMPQGNVHLWREGEIVGQLEMRLLEDEDDVAYLSLIHVAREWRGQGLGKQLHAHAMRVSRELGKRAMRLSVSQRNGAALDFYRGLGWVVAGARPNRLPMTIMEIPVR